MNRRDFLKIGGISGLAAACISADFGNSQEKADTPERGAQKHYFACTLRVNIYGREWYHEFEKNPDPTIKLSPIVRDELSRQFSNKTRTAEFSTIDDFSLNFYPRGLVQFDIYEEKGKEPVARNVNLSTFNQVILPRRNGKVKYSFKTRIPQNDTPFKQDFKFFDDPTILQIALTDPNYTHPESQDPNKTEFNTADILDAATKKWTFQGGLLIPTQSYKGIYQRSFDLHHQESPVQYSVFGLEELAGKFTPEVFAKFFENRQAFNNSIAEFQKYLADKNRLEGMK